MLFLLLPIFVLGHMAILIAVINRAHSTSLPRWFMKLCDLAWYFIMAGIPIAIGSWYLQSTVSGQKVDWFSVAGRLSGGYLFVSFMAAVAAIAERLYRLKAIRTTELLVSNHTHKISVTDAVGHRPVGDWLTSLASLIPNNEILHLSVHEKNLILPRLDQRLDGLRITHISDLHFTGQLTEPFYEELVKQANASESDIVVVTGDIVENRKCLEWLPRTIGQLQAKLGVFYVLGNHDLRIKDEQLVRTTLKDLGMISVGGRAETIRHNEFPIVIGGNELPWFTPAVNFQHEPETIDGLRPFRILLSHSPDQLRWARHNDCDLMFAGHTHGGQFRLPIVGPILSPSNQGSRFASGTFYFEPTMMHVSRGIAGTRPVAIQLHARTGEADSPQPRPSLNSNAISLRSPTHQTAVSSPRFSLMMESKAF